MFTSTAALRIGPVGVAVESPEGWTGWPLDRAHHVFVAPDAQPTLRVQVEAGPIAPRPAQEVFDAGGVWSVHRDGSRWILYTGRTEGVAPPDRRLILLPDGHSATLTLDVGRFPALHGSYPLEYPLEELLFRHLLADHRALLVHACGVAWQGQGYLFVGSSGAGKSTMARLWKAAGGTVLNDDRVLLQASNDGIRIHPTPWFGDSPEVGSEAVPLVGLYLLRKGSEVIFEPIRPAAAAALVFAKSFPPLWDPERIRLTLDTLDLVCRRVPCGWLAVPPDQRAVEWIQVTR